MNSPTNTVGRIPVQPCGRFLAAPVGEVPQDCITVELDDAIRDLATQSALAEDRGDVETAKELSRRQFLRDVEAVEGDPCFWTAIGAIHGERL
jgi:hypothetical protein